MSVVEIPEVDEFGPDQVILVRNHAQGLEAYVVVDNVAAGTAIGGVRMAPDVSIMEVARLARAMTFKNAAAGLPHGGAKSGIVADPSLPFADKVRIVRAFGAAIADVVSYVPGPDMGLDEHLMAHLRDACGRGVGLPPVLGGIPLDVLGATGFGLAVSAEVAAERGVVSLDGARVVVQGFGSVGSHAARYLVQRGARLVAASDSRGAVANPRGLDVEALVAHKRAGEPASTFAGGSSLPAASLIGYPCDIWIPAARPDVLTVDNVAELQARLVLEGANIPASREAEEKLHASGVVVVPDFVANAGGVICASVENDGGTPRQAFDTIDDKIRQNVRVVLEGSAKTGEIPRVVAERLARERVEEAMGYHR